jgi:Ni/Co efflux regulator RcnB
MKTCIAAIALIFASLPAAAAQPAAQDSGKEARQPTAKQQAQRDRMKSCNAKAGERKADDRRKFMADCLSEDGGAAKKPTAQQQRMKDCNREASGKKLKGDERKQFMSGCLKG